MATFQTLFNLPIAALRHGAASNEVALSWLNMVNW
jgi:hypothetical protein